MSILTEFDL